MIMISLLLVAPTGEAIDPGNWIYQLLLVAIAISFFAGFWRYRGQTPGMRAWRLHLTQVNGGPVSPTQALRRFGAAIVAAIPFGLGFWWQWFDGDGLSWPDRWSDTRLCYTPRSRNE